MQFLYDMDVILAVLKGDMAFLDCSIDVETPESTHLPLTAVSSNASPAPESPKVEPFIRSDIRTDSLNPSEPFPLNRSAEGPVVHEPDEETLSRSLVRIMSLFPSFHYPCLFGIF